MAKTTILGPVGQLELLVTEPKVDAETAVAVICHPHPQFSGTMDNKVVTTLHKVFNELDMPTIRFNFRGVGNSEGEFADTVGEIADTVAVLDWAKEQYPNRQIYLAGFSFGAYVSYAVATDTKYADKLTCLVSITMPQYSGLATLPTPNCPWILVQGEADEVVAAEEVFAWLDSLAKKPTLIKMPETSHFFHGKLVELRELLLQQLSRSE